MDHCKRVISDPKVVFAQSC